MRVVFVAAVHKSGDTVCHDLVATVIHGVRPTTAAAIHQILRRGWWWRVKKRRAQANAFLKTLHFKKIVRFIILFV